MRKKFTLIWGLIGMVTVFTTLWLLKANEGLIFFATLMYLAGVLIIHDYLTELIGRLYPKKPTSDFSKLEKIREKERAKLKDNMAVDTSILIETRKPSVLPPPTVLTATKKPLS